MGRWSLVYDGFNPEEEGLREALCTLGNGYLASRAAGTEAVADGVHYPGTYFPGGITGSRPTAKGSLALSAPRYRTSLIYIFLSQ